MQHEISRTKCKRHNGPHFTWNHNNLACRISWQCKTKIKVGATGVHEHQAKHNFRGAEIIDDDSKQLSWQVWSSENLRNKFKVLFGEEMKSRNIRLKCSSQSRVYVPGYMYIGPRIILAAFFLGNGSLY